MDDTSEQHPWFLAAAKPLPVQPSAIFMYGAIRTKYPVRPHCLYRY